ncbi:hypothetical protein QYF61_003447 [Mycteria americana]|uniref:Uncharacterized protein n=1 Tax=Mycteria americana TaxID=33587 RepID=A0AAN7S2F6_MYCAM|nr:hypothetical protein QYF61_003447 [Mycteria americana]
MQKVKKIPRRHGSSPWQSRGWILLSTPGVDISTLSDTRAKSDCLSRRSSHQAAQAWRSGSSGWGSERGERLLHRATRHTCVRILSCPGKGGGRGQNQTCITQSPASYRRDFELQKATVNISLKINRPQHKGSVNSEKEVPGRTADTSTTLGCVCKGGRFQENSELSQSELHVHHADIPLPFSLILPILQPTSFVHLEQVSPGQPGQQAWLSTISAEGQEHHAPPTVPNLMLTVFWAGLELLFSRLLHDASYTAHVSGRQSQQQWEQYGEALQPSDHFHGPLLDPLQQVHVFSVLRAPELDAGLQVPLGGIPPLRRVNCTTQLGVICKVAEGALDLAVNVIDENIEQHWSQYGPLRTPLINDLHLDTEPLTATLWMRPSNQFLIHQTVHPSNLYLSNLERSMLQVIPLQHYEVPYKGSPSLPTLTSALRTSPRAELISIALRKSSFYMSALWNSRVQSPILIMKHIPLSVNLNAGTLCEPMPAGSKTDPPLAKAELISDGGSASLITYLRRGKKPLHSSNCSQRKRS